MIQLNSVLVAFDFGEMSQQVLVYGQSLTRSFGGRLHILHVADVIATTASQSAEALALKHLRSLVPDGSATLAVRISASPANAIVEYARSIHADAIVVGTHGRDGVPRILMGSVAELVVRHAPCPVLVVRPNEHKFVLPDPVTAAARI